MRENIHPAYPAAKVHCACGATWVTRSTHGDLHLDICSNCHPFFTGKQKLIDKAGRVERFRKRYSKKETGKPGEGAPEAVPHFRARRRARLDPEVQCPFFPSGDRRWSKA